LRDQPMKVYALVGGSGTGKSHRASFVAHEHNIDFIIDDGLLIRGGKILAGKSAKQESTRVGAIKRAIFFDPGHAQEVKRVLEELHPERLLILATSNGMVQTIVEALELPPVTRVVMIEEIASLTEIERAKHIRKLEGKHVIPVPTLEVKKTFSGYMVDPLRFFLRGKQGENPSRLIEKSVVRPTFSFLGNFFIDDTVVNAIASRAASEIKGVTGILRVSVDSATVENSVEINIAVSVRYGINIMDVLVKVQQRVMEQVEYMTALEVSAVNASARRLTFDQA